MSLNGGISNWSMIRAFLLNLASPISSTCASDRPSAATPWESWSYCATLALWKNTGGNFWPYFAAWSLSPTQQVQLFTTGLQKSQHTNVEPQHTTNLQTTMSLARAYEERLTEELADPKQLVKHKQAPAAAPSATPSAPFPAATTSKQSPNTASTQLPALHSAAVHFRHLTVEEMADWRAKGLCYNCPEKFHRDHHCSMKGIYMIKIEEDDSEDQDKVEISLHALTRIHAGQTMQLHVQIASVTLLALDDSGSTHTFVAKEAACKAGITPAPRPRMKVVVTNGDHVECPGLCGNVQLTIGEEFAVDCYVIPLDGFDVVLGVQ